jgi:hypothetical protein
MTSLQRSHTHFITDATAPRPPASSCQPSPPRCRSRPRRSLRQCSRHPQADLVHTTSSCCRTYPDLRSPKRPKPRSTNDGITEQRTSEIEGTYRPTLLRRIPLQQGGLPPGYTDPLLRSFPGPPTLNQRCAHWSLPRCSHHHVRHLPSPAHPTSIGRLLPRRSSGRRRRALATFRSFLTLQAGHVRRGGGPPRRKDTSSARGRGHYRIGAQDGAKRHSGKCN